MVRATLALILAAVLAAAVAWLADHAGSVTLHWQNTRIDTSLAVLAAAAALLAAAAALLYQLWRWLMRAPRSFRRHRREQRRLKGYKALTQGMVAVAAGDAREAQRQARRADVLLNEPPLTMLLSAQAAQLNGDEAAAARYFRAMLERRETEFLGLRGLIMQATKQGDGTSALALARRAKALRPETGWVLATLYELEARAGRWREAAETARLAVRRGSMSAAEGARKRALACYEESLAEAKAGRPEAALAAARKAVGLDATFLPGSLAAAELLARRGKRRRAERVLEAAWTEQPHPVVAARYLAVGGEAEPLRRMMRVQRLIAHRPAHRESWLALAEAALAARLWGEARRALARAESEDGALARAESEDGALARAEDGASARVCRLHALLEEGEHGDGAAARRWLSRAAAATPEPQWLCARCGMAHGEWTPFCRGCGAYDALAWRSPSRALPLPAAATAAKVPAAATAAKVPAAAAAAEVPSAAPAAPAAVPPAHAAPQPAEAVTDLGA